MAAPSYSTADFANGLQNLLPTGRAWPREPDAVVSQVIKGLAPSYSRQHARGNALLVDAFPKTAVQLLPEWELTVGLPDPCAGPDPTIAQRQAHVAARLTYTGGQSVPFYVGFALQLGYAITIEEYVPARVGRFRVGQRLYGRDWAHAWTVHAPAVTVSYFRVGQSRVGERLANYGNSVLRCELERIAPAHTILKFLFATPTLTGADDAPLLGADGALFLPSDARRL
jgi:uncharacterized protein YmfQ (DUF2313 family)